MAKAKKAKTPSAIALLIEDHDYVKQAYRDFQKMDHEDHEALQVLVKNVCAALETHTRLEEEIFYPPVRRALDDEDLMNEAEIEHDSAKTLIRQLKRMKPSDPRYVAAFTVLCEYVEHHAKEEEDEMFPKVRRARLDLQALGRKLQARKIALAARAGRSRAR
jgi:hemerythrin superfamily protein